MWVARETNGTLALWLVKPVVGWYDGPVWDVPNQEVYEKDFAIVIDSNLFPDLKFEDGPKEVELKLK